MSMIKVLDLIAKIILTVALCGIIGAERSTRHKGAGLRTHILVGLGSSLIVLTSLYIFDIYKQETVVDPTRMITGIVTGVGFLCAGAIIRGGTNVSGLTTAASLWIVSGIGMAVGSGYCLAAVFVTIVVFFVLSLLPKIESKIEKRFGA